MKEVKNFMIRILCMYTKRVFIIPGGWSDELTVTELKRIDNYNYLVARYKQLYWIRAYYRKWL